MEPTEQRNRMLLRARDRIDRDYREELDVPALAAVACLSRAEFIRQFRDTFGEPPHRYLQRRRIERAMALLQWSDRTVTEVCMEVGFSSLGTFSRTFTAVVGTSPSAYRAGLARTGRPAGFVPTAFGMRWNRVVGPPMSSREQAGPTTDNDEAPAIRSGT